LRFIFFHEINLKNFQIDTNAKKKLFIEISFDPDSKILLYQMSKYFTEFYWLISGCDVNFKFSAKLTRCQNIFKWIITFIRIHFTSKCEFPRNLERQIINFRFVEPQPMSLQKFLQKLATVSKWMCGPRV